MVCPPFGGWAKDGSSPSIGVTAARAVGYLPYPFRTRQISPPAFRPVLAWETRWERWFAADHSYQTPTEQQRSVGVFVVVDGVSTPYRYA